VDPLFQSVVDGRGIEVVQLLPPPAHGRDDAGRLEHREVLADRLPGHVEAGAQLAQGLPVAGVQAVEEASATRIGERPEHCVHLGSSSEHAAIWLPIMGKQLIGLHLKDAAARRGSTNHRRQEPERSGDPRIMRRWRNSG
jgi:hypothetical protein